MTGPIRVENPIRRVTTAKATLSTVGRCAVCGGLECLCRPRFFAGQLLTEEEFNRLDRYIIEKNKLHNRHLHGWGVVCGLDVICGPCGEGVIVREGYALSPCGEDIVVCSDTQVDICGLINACRKPDQSDCGDPYSNRGCEETEQAWVLAICYDESTSRGVTPLRNGPSSTGPCGNHGTSTGTKSSGCGCGGSPASSAARVAAMSTTTSGGCGCGGSTASTTARSGTGALQCEPTVVCEGYRFRVYPAPRGAAAEKRPAGAMATRFQECFQELRDIFPPTPTQTTPQTMHEWCCAARDALIDYLDSHPVYDCELRRAARAIVCPPVTAPAAMFAETYQQIMAIAGELMIACFCRALQPPCPGPVEDNCVPLAVINTSRANGNCVVTSICNWTTLRKHVITMPTLQYWLSILPVGEMIREALERFCCSGGGYREFRQGVPGTTVNDATTNTPTTNNTALFNATAAAGAAPGSADAAARAATGAEEGGMSQKRSLNDISPSSYFRAGAGTMRTGMSIFELATGAAGSVRESLDAASLIGGMLGQTRGKDEPIFSEAQRSNPAQFFVLDQMVKPIVRAFSTDIIDATPMAAFLRAFASPDAAETRTAADATAKAPTAKTAATSATADDVQVQLKELREMVKRQQETIDRLSVDATSAARTGTAAAKSVSTATKTAAKATTKTAAKSTTKATTKATAKKTAAKRITKRDDTSNEG